MAYYNVLLCSKNYYALMKGKEYDTYSFIATTRASDDWEIMKAPALGDSTNVSSSHLLGFLKEFITNPRDIHSGYS